MTATIRALLSDGRIATIRRLGPADTGPALRLHTGLPNHDQYTRFFTVHPTGLDRLFDRMLAEPNSHELALGAFLGDELVGMASFSISTDGTDGTDGTEAEVALVVEHGLQTRGVGTLLLEHLGSAARVRGVKRFVAEVLAENTAMLRVFRDCGFPETVQYDSGTCQVTLDLTGDEYPAQVEERERLAGIASLTALLRPTSVAVVGASRRRDAVGNAVVRNLLAAGFPGACYPVNPHADLIEGLPVTRSVAELPPGIDLAILCVPAGSVPAVADECGRQGVRALVVITAGLTGRAELMDGLLAAARTYGMRLVGPNCLGVINTEARMSASFARGVPPAGRVGVVTQSGGMAIALLDQLAGVGLGVSTLVSTGDKYDVSGNDLLLWWQRDEATDLAVLYLESFGNPRKFSRLARTLSERKPVLTIRTGTSEVAQRAAASHTAAAATPVATRDALFGQAGVIAVDSTTELLAAIAALSWQPLPAGNRVAVVSNAGGAGVLAADACARHRLVLPALSDPTLAALGELLPPTASLDNPVDTTAGVDEATFARCLRTVAADSGVDSVIAIAAPTAITEPASGIADAVTGTAKPLYAVQVGLTTVQPLAASGGRTVPTFADPAVAAGALAAVTGYAQWRARPSGSVPDLPGIDVEQARWLVAAHLAEHPDGGWLEPNQVTELLGCFSVPFVGGEQVGGGEQLGDAAVLVASRFGFPVAVKAIAADVLHKSRAGGVLLGLRDAAEVRTAVASLAERFGSALTGVLVQPMVERGRELLVGIRGDATFGPLVVLAVGGVDTDLVADRAARLVPLTDVDATELIDSLRVSPALFGDKATEPLDTSGLADLLLRIGRLADALPEIAEVDLNPVVLTASSCLAIDARIRVEPAQTADPYLRRLRT